MFLMPQGRLARLALFLCVMSVSLAVHAQSVAPEDEFRERVRVNEDINPLGENALGESVSLYNGALSFRQTDIDLAGTGPRLQLVRTLGVADEALRGRPGSENSLGFADWELEIPHIETLSANVGGNSPTAPVTWFFQDDPNRCSTLKQANDIFISRQVQFDGAGPPFHYSASSWWHGYKLVIPGLGGQDLLIRDSQNTLSPQMKWDNGSSIDFNIVTLKHWQIACLPSTSNGAPGEGFLVVSPEGTKYWMDRLIIRPAATMGMGISSSYAQLKRHAVMMMTSRVEDRFGNYLSYSYNGMGNLVSIHASDGRSLTLTYNDQTQVGRVDTATLSSTDAPSRTWKYTYTNLSIPGSVSMRLGSVQLPDGTSWEFDLSKFSWGDDRFIRYGGIYDGSMDCIPSWIDPAPITDISIRGPTGLTGTFSIAPMARGRSYVPYSCSQDENGDGHHHLAIPNLYSVVALKSKTYSGAGIADQTWTYDYSNPNQSWLSDCSGGCTAGVWTDVIDPSENRTRYTFSNRFDNSESQLLSTNYYAGATGSELVRSVTSSYASPTAGPWPAHLGATPQVGMNSAQLEQLAPKKQEVIAQSGDSFTWMAESFDIFAQAAKTKRFNSIPGQGQIEEQVTYLNDFPHWVLGLPVQLANLTTGETVNKNVYDLFKVTLKERWRFGQKLMSYTFNGSGQLASFTDGNGHTTSLGNYKRGIPQLIGYPDARSQKLVVDDFGQISNITDQSGNTTSYSYDLAGRLTQITYPAGDEKAWLPKGFTYAYVTNAERGIGPNHWRRTISKGDARWVTYFDAMLRPVLSDSYINNVSGSNATTLTNYNAKGQEIFASYPDVMPLNFTMTPSAVGVMGGTTTYDALGRMTRVQQNSELGTLTRTTAYLSGARQQITDPRSKVTTTSYQVFDQPSYDAVIKVQAPAGITQTITRDIYGNPLSITQSGLYGAELNSVTKTLTYDAYHRLCRTAEPESGSEVMGYDGANNLAWSVSGAILSADGNCHPELAQSPNVTTRTYDPMNRVLTILPPAFTQSTQYHYTPLGQPDRVVSGISTWSGTYNYRGMLTGESLQLAGRNAWGIGYAHDAYGNLSLVHYPDGENVSYAPDALGRPTQVGGYASGIGYFPNGQVAQFIYGNGTAYATEQNGRKLLSNFSYGTNTTVQVSEDVSYDANGNISSVTDLAGGPRSKAFTYDDLNRLSTATAASLWGSETYTYDALNNLRSGTSHGQTETFHYDTTNKLANITNGASTVDSFLYDNRGNVINKNGATLAFDQKNQLTQIQGYDDYAYDAAGRRVMKTPAGGAPTYYFYNQAGQLLYQLDAATLKSTNFIYLGTKMIARNGGYATHVVGNFEGVALDPSNNATMSGWACSTEWSQPIDVEVFVGGTRTGGGTHIATVTANVASESAVAAACITSGTTYRFAIPLTFAVRNQYPNALIYVYGDSPVGAGASPLDGFGVYKVPPVVPDTAPVLSAPEISGTGGYTVTWDSVTAASIYTLQERVNDGGWSTIQTSGALSKALTGKVEGTYGYQVQACNVSGCGPWSSAANTTVIFPPSPPAAITVPATSSGNVAVNWTASTGATNYTLQQKLDSSAWSTVYTGAASASAHSVTTSGSYTYQVKACNAGGCSTYKASSPVVVTIPPVSAPPLTVPTTSSTGSYKVSWSAVTAATSYTLQEQLNGGSWSTVQTSNSTSRTISGKGNGSYGYRAQACNAGGCGPWSSRIVTTVRLPPSAAPTLSVPSSSTTGSYTVSWTAVSDADSYVLQELVNAGGWIAVQSSSARNKASGYKVNGTYSYRVQACNASGCGPWAGVKSIGVAIPPPVYSAPQVKLNGTWHTGSMYQSSPAFTTTYECVYRVTISYAGLVVTLTSPTATASSSSGTGTAAGTFVVGSGHFVLTATGSHMISGSLGSRFNRCQGAISGP